MEELPSRALAMSLLIEIKRDGFKWQRYVCSHFWMLHYMYITYLSSQDCFNRPVSFVMANAGFEGRGCFPISSQAFESDLREVMETNFFGMYVTIRHFLSTAVVNQAKQSISPSIVMLSSGVSLMNHLAIADVCNLSPSGQALCFSYIPSKHAVNALVRATAASYPPL